MGMYLNPGPAMFRQGRNSSTYVDKSMPFQRGHALNSPS